MKNTWPTKKLGEVCEFITPGVGEFRGLKKYIATADVDYDKIVGSADITYGDRPSRADVEVQDGDVLVAKMAQTHKFLLATEEHAQKYIFSTGFAILRARDELTPKYLFYFLTTKEFNNQKDKLATGATQKAINNSSLEKIKIPLPPLEIQKRIVARIDELFEKIDKARELRQKAQGQTAEILPAALQKIFKKAEKKWEIEKIENIVVDFQSGFASSKRANENEGIPQLRPNNIGFGGEIDLTNLVSIPSKFVDLDKYKLREGDVLFNNTNSKELVGRAVLVKENLDYVFSNHITRLKVDSKFLFPEWLVIDLNYLWSTEYFLKYSQKWIGQAGINTQMLKSIEIPLPSLPEQKKIVAYLDNLREKVDKLKQIQQRQSEELNELKSSILNRAFSGKL